MYTFILMIIDFFKNNNFHFFMFFFLFIIIRWAIVYFHAIKYKPYRCEDEKINFFSSVIIPVVDEPTELFQNVLEKIASQKPSEIIVVINGPRNIALEHLCSSFNKNLQPGMTGVWCYYTSKASKRNAIRVGLKHVDPRSDITLLVDSDTIWTDRTLIELLKPFACDDTIGGVTTRQKILEPNRKLVTMFANLLEEIRAEGTMKAMSVTGKVGCLPGRTIAFRTSIMRDVIDEFMTETFMGFHKEVSDDRSLTNLTLKRGYKTVMQDTSVVYTDAPVEWKKFIRQQLRWAEGSQYNNLRMTPWMFKNAKLMAFIYWSDMLMPMLLISVYANILICKILNDTGHLVQTITYHEPWWIVVIFIILGCIFSFGSRNIKVMKTQKWYYVPLIPVFIVVLTVIMVPVRLCGLMKCSDDMGWGTRKISQKAVQESSARSLTPPVHKRRLVYYLIPAVLLVCLSAVMIWQNIGKAPMNPPIEESETSEPEEEDPIILNKEMPRTDTTGFETETSVLDPTTSGDTSEVSTVEPTPDTPVVVADSPRFVGVYISNVKEAEKYKNGLNTLAWFDNFDSVSVNKLEECLGKHNYKAFITLQPKNISMYDIADGKCDDKVIAYLQHLSAGDYVNTELFVRFAHEMESTPWYEDWYSWQTPDYDVYIRAWRHLVTLARQYAPNAKWVWSPNRATQYADLYYPGDEYVDYVSLTLNNFANECKTFGEFYENKGTRNHLLRYNKPVIFGEIGVFDDNTPQTSAYVASVFDALENYPECFGVIFLDKDVNENRMFKFSDNQQAVDTFVAKASAYHTKNDGTGV